MGDFRVAVHFGVRLGGEVFHNIRPTDDGPARQAAREYFGEAREVRRHAVVRLRTARRYAKAAHHLIEDE